MKIVIEGFDATGKSTLAQALAEKLGLEVLEAGPKPFNDVQAIKNSKAQLDANNVVNCRITPLSRLAYNHEVSGGHKLELWRLVSEYIRRGTIFVYCTRVADTHVVKEYDTAEHLEYIEKNRDYILARYKTMFNLIPHFTYDHTVDKMEDLVCKIAAHF